MYGVFADISSFRSLGLTLIEDCAQAVGFLGDKAIRGDIAVFSFHPTKCLTTGEGGMAVSQDPYLVDKMRTIRDGKDEKPSKRLFSPLSNIAAALGLSQLKRYHEGLRRREKVAQIYINHLKETHPSLLNYEAFSNSMFFRFPLLVDGGAEKFQNEFMRAGVCVRKGVDRLGHRLLSLSDTQFPVATNLYQKTMSIPIYPDLTDNQADQILNACDRILGETFSS